jgi:hypothetical protein
MMQINSIKYRCDLKMMEVAESRAKVACGAATKP